MIRIPTNRCPTHPGEMLLEEFLRPMGMSQRAPAKAVHVPYQSVNELVNRHRRMTPRLALRLARFFGMSASFWMNLQLRWDLYHANQEEATHLKTIQPYTPREEQAGLWENTPETSVRSSDNRI